MFFRQISLSIEHVGDNTLGPEHVGQVLLAEPVRFHEMPYDVQRSRFRYGIMSRLKILDKKRKQLNQLSLASGYSLLGCQLFETMYVFGVLLLIAHNLGPGLSEK